MPCVIVNIPLVVRLYVEIIHGLERVDIIIRTGGHTWYTTYISVDLVHHEIFCAKVGKGGI